MKYTGNCHCKKVSFEVETDLSSVISCNCSHCGIKSLLLNFVASDKFKLISGENNLISYKFNKHVIDHLFCNTCGVEPFAKGKDKEGHEVVSINVRCLNGINHEEISITKVDGKNW